MRQLRILQNTKSCGLSVPRCHESPSPTAAGAPGGGSTNNYTHAEKRDVTLNSVPCHAAAQH